MFTRIRWSRWMGSLVVGATILTAANSRAQEAVLHEDAAVVELHVDESSVNGAPQEQQLRVIVDSPKDQRLHVVREFSLSAAAQSKYKIGIAVGSADATLRSQLGLGENQGVVVLGVEEDSPAAKAGLKKHDLLLSLGEHEFGNAKQLIKAVEEIGEKTTTAKFLRGGKEQTAEISPTKRPEEEELSFELHVAPFQHGEGPLRFNIPLPGAIFAQPGEAGKRVFAFVPGAEIPDNLEISITKTGKQPAKIVVRRGDQSWETTEDKLEELPEDVRPHVQRFLGRPHVFGLPRPGGVELRALDRARRAIRLTQPRRLRVLREAAPRSTRKRLDEMSKQIEQLRKALEALKTDLPQNDEQPSEEQNG